MAVITKDQAISRLGRARSSLMKIRENTDRLLYGVGAAVGAMAMAYAVGRLRAYAAAKGYSLNIPKTAIPIPMTLGVVLAVVGSTPLVSESSGLILQAVGVGMATADAALLGFGHQAKIELADVLTIIPGNGNGNGNGGLEAATQPGQGTQASLLPGAIPDIPLPQLDLPNAA